MNENQGQYLIKCICGFEIENDDTTIVCNKCDTWQHSECYYVDEHGQTPRIRVLEGLEHCCVDCKPRPLDAKGATNRQMKRMEKRVEYNKAVAMADKEAKKEKSRDSFQESTTAGSDTPSDWSVVEEQILRALFRKHGTDWTTIAKMMQTKTDSMVWISFPESSDESIAHERRTRSGITTSEPLPTETYKCRKIYSVSDIKV